MPKLIGEIQKYTIIDPDSGDKIVISYRKPFTRELISYWAAIWDPVEKTLKGDDLLDEARISWGGKIIQGIEVMSKRGFSVSSDPDSPAYVEDWKGWLQNKAPQILETLALKVFSGVNLGEKEEALPPEKKS